MLSSNIAGNNNNNNAKSDRKKGFHPFVRCDYMVLYRLYEAVGWFIIISLFCYYLFALATCMYVGVCVCVFLLSKRDK